MGHILHSLCLLFFHSLGLSAPALGSLASTARRSPSRLSPAFPAYLWPFCKSSLSSRHSHLLNTIGSIGRFELAEGEQQLAACATVGANGQPVGLSATSTRRPCNRVAAPRRRRATSERLAVGTLPAVRGLRSDTCGVRRAMHAHHLHRGHTPQSWRLLPSLPSFPWSFCTSLGEPREHSSAIALTPLPSLSCLPLALLCARTTLFARVSLYRADSHDFRLVLHRRALLAWPTCFSFGDPVEHRSRHSRGLASAWLDWRV